MTAEEIKDAARKYATEALVEADNYWHLYNGYVAGYDECLNQQEWKNLYAEGLEVGLKMLRDYDKKTKKNAEAWELLAGKINDWSEQNEDGPTDKVIADIWWEINNNI